jgi:hypothetical protein
VCGYVDARVSIAIVRATHLCLRGSRVPTSQMSNRRPVVGVGLSKIDHLTNLSLFHIESNDGEWKRGSVCVNLGRRHLSLRYQYRIHTPMNDVLRCLAKHGRFTLTMMKVLTVFSKLCLIGIALLPSLAQACSLCAGGGSFDPDLFYQGNFNVRCFRSCEIVK